MSKTLQYNRTNNRSYRHFSLPPAGPVVNRKLEFFYIGKRAGFIDRLVNCFESGYAAENVDQARAMLQRLNKHSHTVPSVVIAEGSLGHSALASFSKFLSSHDKMMDVPFFVEGSALAGAELEKFGIEPIADDIISLNELTNDKLVTKINFWKRIKEKTVKSNISDDTNLSPTGTDIAKRVFDIVLSALLMIILSPLFLLIMLALRIESKGPVFYISKRAGKGYKIFSFYKFRTMEVEANKKISDVSHLNLYNPLNPDGPVFIKIDNDPRITRLGAFLRKCSLDELPQLLNVFKGDMSLVGNRPLPLYEASSLTTDEWATRFLAPAGMTGLWQIRRKTKYKMTAEERIKLDINYAEKSNFLFDLWIMVNTPTAVIQRTNA
ncbi:MAG: sugar transferase [Chitinophagaceae bacterium]|nr:sugar transferase [Chitinophagaceae bacterium]